MERREPPTIDFYPDARQVVTNGGSVLFQCRVVTGIPSPKLSWRRLDGRALGANVETLVRLTQLVRLVRMVKRAGLALLANIIDC